MTYAAATCANVAECLPYGTRQRYCMQSVGLLPSAGTQQKWNVPCAEALPSDWGSALGKEVVCRVLVVWHSAKHRALGIYAVSGSASMVLPFGSDPLIHSNLESRTVRLAKDALNVLSLASMLGLVQCTVVLPCISLPSCRPNAGISSDANFSFSVTRNNR